MDFAIKICGTTTRDDALYALEAGADYIGFILYPESPRCISPLALAQLMDQTEELDSAVGVFVNTPAQGLSTIAHDCNLCAIQLHGDEPPEACLGHAVPVIRALHVGEDFEPEQMRSFLVDTFLLDTAKVGKYGGTGETFDWSKAIAAKRIGRIVLSGGLTPGNVAEAIAAVMPYAVDTSSGVEAEPGKKDHGKVKQFLKAVHVS